MNLAKTPLSLSLGDFAGVLDDLGLEDAVAAELDLVGGVACGGHDVLCSSFGVGVSVFRPVFLAGSGLLEHVLEWSADVVDGAELVIERGV